MRIRDAQARIDIPKEWQILHLYLIGRDDEVFDFHRQGPDGSTGHPAVPAGEEESGASANRLARAQRLGEGERIEFKTFVDLSSRKAAEIWRTVIAFANAHGGEIFIGVENDLTITGVETGARKAQDGTYDLAMCIEKYRGAVVSKINDFVAPSVKLETAIVKAGSRHVLAVRVPRGDTPPYYSVEDKRIHIRRGANNVPADPSMDLPLLFGRRQRFRPGVAGDPLARFDAEYGQESERMLPEARQFGG